MTNAFDLANAERIAATLPKWSAIGGGWFAYLNGHKMVDLPSLGLTLVYVLDAEDMPRDEVFTTHDGPLVAIAWILASLAD